MIKLLYIGGGGFLGAISRYIVSVGVQRIVKNPFFPLGTMAVNLAGCFLIGLAMGIVEARQPFSPEVRSMILIGFLGAFTTFSTFSYEAFTLLRDDRIVACSIYLIGQIIPGLLLVWLGQTIITAKFS